MEPEHLFELFRKTREPARLGAVFDLVADDLFAVALHLTPDTAEAEDLVQATFLAALRRAATWDASRPLRPWLLGLLQREARHQRRRARRRPEPMRLPPRPPEPTPVETALAAETAQAVRAAVEGLPQPYKQVVELRLLQSLPPDAIAAVLQRSPGAVRTQLWRGLELLRRALPKGVALSAPTILAPVTARAAVRAQVVAAASSMRAGAAGIGVLAGALLMKNLVLAIAATAAVVLGIAWLGSRSPRAEPLQSHAPAGAPEGVRVTASEPSAERADVPARTAIAPHAAREPAAPPATAPYDAHLLVVDARGDLVPDAQVLVFEPVRSQGKGGETVLGESRAPGPPFLTTTTDTAGRCVLRLDRDACFVRAEKDAVGTTGDRLLQGDMPELRSEWRLRLERTVRVTGIVLATDRVPVAGASVVCRVYGNRPQQRAAPPPPVETDADGRFAFDVVPGGHCRLSARHGGRPSETVEFEMDDFRDRDIELRFAGTYTVRGVLLGDDGQPVRGRVIVVPAADEGQPNRRVASSESGDDGHFELRLTESGAYDVAGGIAGSSAACARVVLDDACPHQQLTLRTRPFAILAGRVVDERGGPRAGVHVGLGNPSARTPLLGHLSHLHGKLPSGPTAADGSFQFLAPAGYRYRIGCRPIPTNRHLWVEKQEVEAPAEGIVVVFREADVEGFRLTGRVVHAKTGAPATQFEVSVITHDSPAPGMWLTSILAGVDSTDGSFEVGPLNPGKRYSFAIKAPGLARAHVGPFDATARTEDVRVALATVGSLRCIVRRADGAPGVAILVRLRPTDESPFGHRPFGETDREGVVRLEDVVPGRYRVTATVLYAEPQHAEVDVLPGCEAHVELTLPP